MVISFVFPAPADESCDKVSGFNSDTNFTDWESWTGGGRLAATGDCVAAAAARAWILV